MKIRSIRRAYWKKELKKEQREKGISSRQLKDDLNTWRISGLSPLKIRPTLRNRLLTVLGFPELCR